MKKEYKELEMQVIEVNCQNELLATSNGQVGAYDYAPQDDTGEADEYDCM